MHEGLHRSQLDRGAARGAGRPGIRAPRRARPVDRKPRGARGQPCGRPPTGRGRDGPPPIAGAAPPAEAWVCPTGWRRTAGRRSPGDRSAAGPTSPRRASAPTTGRRATPSTTAPTAAIAAARSVCTVGRHAAHPGTAHRQSVRSFHPDWTADRTCVRMSHAVGRAGTGRRRRVAARHAADPGTAAQRPGARVPRADLPRGPREERAEPRAGRFGDAVPVDDQSLSGMQSCVHLLLCSAHA